MVFTTFVATTSTIFGGAIRAAEALSGGSVSGPPSVLL
jgi:hypothetical protein